MEDIFNLLSSTARIDKSKRKKQKNKKRHRQQHPLEEEKDDKHSEIDGSSEEDEPDQEKSRDRTGKRDLSEEKQKQIHREQIAAFRRSMAIRIANKHDPDVPDPISSFHELATPSWWGTLDVRSFQQAWKAMLGNVEAGRWKEPTPIQMQAIPTLLDRRDFIGAATTGSGKSGAFILPALLLSSTPHDLFYGAIGKEDTNDDGGSSKKKSKKKKKKEKQAKTQEGEIRSLIVAPTLELASQLHREVERLGLGKPGGVSSLLLSKSNAANVLSGTAGGKNGLDVLVTTPLRLVDIIEKGLKLDSIRAVILDEADRLLDAADGSSSKKHKSDPGDSSDEEEEDSSDEETDPKMKKSKRKNQAVSQAEIQPTSGSSQTKSFLAQMDIILSEIPSTAIRAMFSATVTPMVRSLADSVLRNPVDVTIAAPGTDGGANRNIDQQLMFVGREEGKLLAMRQLSQRGQLKAPVIVFVQSQERAQALFAELLYDGLHVDVIHAGRSKSARDNAVAKFRKGDTWVLICTDLVARGVDFRAVNMVINYDLPASGVSYIHRIGRCGRAGRQGTAITLFTEADFENLRTIANVMKQSGCKVEDWMLNLKKNKRSEKNKKNPKRYRIDTTPKFGRLKKRRRQEKEQQKDSNQAKKNDSDDGDGND